MTQNTTLDIVIAGGGASGLSLALGLANSSYRVGVIEASDYQETQVHPGFDARSIALAKYSQQVLDAWGLDIANIGEPIKNIKVTDQGHIGQCQIDHTDYQLDALGYVVELQALGNQLRNQLAQQDISWFTPDSISAIAQTSEQVNLTLQSGQAVSCRLLVVAEGAAGNSVSLLGLQQSTQAYQQTALIANVGVSHAHQNRAFERFTPTGPLALLPMQGQRMSLVWTLSAEQAEHYQHCSEAEFLSALQSAFGYDLGIVTQVGERSCYPLALSTSESIVHHRTVILGNTAHTLHPIAGQGFNLGVRDVKTLCDLLLTQTDLDPGAYSLLQRYRKAREPDQQRVIQLTDGLVRLFSNRHESLVVGRNLGLLAMAFLPGLRSQLARQAMGLFAEADSLE